MCHRGAGLVLGLGMNLSKEHNPTYLTNSKKLKYKKVKKNWREIQKKKTNLVYLFTNHNIFIYNDSTEFIKLPKIM